MTACTMPSQSSYDGSGSAVLSVALKRVKQVSFSLFAEAAKGVSRGQVLAARHA